MKTSPLARLAWTVAVWISLPLLPLGGGCLVPTLDEDNLLCGPSDAGGPDAGVYSCLPGYSCAVQICVPDPTGALTCPLPAVTTGTGTYPVQGEVTSFPDNSIDCNGGDVSTVFIDSDGGETLASPTCNSSTPGYSVTLPAGIYTALVTADGGLPTYFPGLVVGASTATGPSIDLFGVVPPTYDVTPGHIVWVGRMEDVMSCLPVPDGGSVPVSYFNGYSVGLSPAPGELDAGLPGGEFVALDGPYVSTEYVVLSDGGTLLWGTFNPPPFAGTSIAVELIYPNWGQ